MSEYFKGVEEEKNLIPPDYSSNDSTLDDDDPDDIDEEIIGEDDDTKIDAIFKEQETVNEKNMTTSPFNNPQTSVPSWNGPSWGVSQNNNPWQPKSNTPSWNGIATPTYSGSQKVEINRSKKVIFCDLLDCITETYQSDGRPGLRPRDIYDFKFRFEVWQKIAAFNPEKVFIMIPKNLLPISANGLDSWDMTLGYFCCSLSAFLRLPDVNCQILLQSHVGQRKEDLISTTMSRMNIEANDAIQIGIYSGYNGLSDEDKVSADRCKIDYIDLNQLLNSN